MITSLCMSCPAPLSKTRMVSKAEESHDHLSQRYFEAAWNVILGVARTFESLELRQPIVRTKFDIRSLSLDPLKFLQQLKNQNQIN